MSHPLIGLTVRWSLADSPADTLDKLTAYVAETSHQRFQGMGGLMFKTWRAIPGQWFEGCYVFESDEARKAFQETFTAGAADAPGSQLVGAEPILIEACQITAIAEGATGFFTSSRYPGRPQPWTVHRGIGQVAGSHAPQAQQD